MGERQTTGIQLLGHREQLQLKREKDQRKLVNVNCGCFVAHETSSTKTPTHLHAGSVGFAAEHSFEKFQKLQPLLDSSNQDSSVPRFATVASRQHTDNKMHTILEYRAGKLQHQQEKKSSKFSISESSSANHGDLASVPLILQAPESFNRKHHLLQNGHASSELTTVKAQHNSVNCSASEDVPRIDQLVNGNCLNSTDGRRGGGGGDAEKAKFTNNLHKQQLVMKSSTRSGSSSSQCQMITSNGVGSYQSNMLQRQFLLNNGGGINPMTTNGGVLYNELHSQTTKSEPKNNPFIDSLERNTYAKRQSMNKSEPTVAKNGNWMIEGTPSKHTTMSILNGNLSLNKFKGNILKKSHSVSTPSLNRYSPPNVTSMEVERMSKNRVSSSSSRGSDVVWEELCSDDEDSGFFLQENDSDADGIGECCYHSFAGFRNYMMPERVICGETGTVRGMRNRVRAGIATFLHQTTGNKNFHQLEANKVVIYTTTTGIVRGTFQQCLKVKTILSTLLVSFEERDIFKCRAYQRELVDRLDDENVRDRLDDENVRVPQVFVEGYHLGDANVIEKLNECGRLRKILRPYKRANANKPCHKCGGYLLLLCSACNGSKKSVTRNQFSDSLAPLRCTKCDECGLIPCDLCCSVQPLMETTGKV